MGMNGKEGVFHNFSCLNQEPLELPLSDVCIMYVVFSQFVWPELSVPDLFLQFLTRRKLYISD